MSGFCPIISSSQYQSGKRGLVIIRYMCTMAIMITNLYISLFLLCRLSKHNDEIWFGLKRKQWQLLLRLFSFNAWKMIIYILHRGKTEWLDVAYGQAVYLTEIISSYVMMAFLVRKYIIYSEKKTQVTNKVRP